MSIFSKVIRLTLLVALSVIPGRSSSDCGLSISFGKLGVQVRHHMDASGPHVAQVSTSHLLFELLDVLESNEDFFVNSDFSFIYYIDSNPDESKPPTQLTLEAYRGQKEILTWTRPLKEHLCPQVIGGILEAMGQPQAKLKRSGKVRLSLMLRGKDDNDALKLPKGAVGRVFLGPLPGFYDHWAIPGKTVKAQVVTTRKELDHYFQGEFPPWDERLLLNQRKGKPAQ